MGRRATMAWPTQIFGWMGHNAFGPTNNWPVCLMLEKISKIGATTPLDVRF